MTDEPIDVRSAYAQVAAVSGMNLWTTDWFLPQFHDGEMGAWKINPGGSLVIDWGYFTGRCMVETLPALLRKLAPTVESDEYQWVVWMSLTPHEIESQELACRYAYQHVVVLGLGMGFIAANIALNPRVTKVTVIEIDPDVIDLFRNSGAFDSLAQTALQKITIVNADATEWCPEATDKVDFLYADIWLHLAEPGTISQVRQMQANIQADAIYFWGQEIAIHCAARKHAANGAPLTAEAVQRAVSEVIKLPLLVPDDLDYPGMIDKVIDYRIERELPIDVDFG